MTAALYENDSYEVHLTPDALDEDTTSRAQGYGIFNKSTKVREGTAMVFGEARWRADQYHNMIKELDEREAVEVTEIEVADDEDVVPTLN